MILIESKKEEAIGNDWQITSNFSDYFALSGNLAA